MREVERMQRTESEHEAEDLKILYTFLIRCDNRDIVGRVAMDKRQLTYSDRTIVQPASPKNNSSNKILIEGQRDSMRL